MAVVLTGAGGYFTSGADVKELQTGRESSSSSERSAEEGERAAVSRRHVLPCSSLHVNDVATQLDSSARPYFTAPPSLERGSMPAITCSSRTLLALPRRPNRSPLLVSSFLFLPQRS